MSLEIYKDISLIKAGKNQSIYLVQSEIDQLFYIKKILDTYDISIYQTLKELHLPHIPSIKEIYEINQQCIIIEEYINHLTLDSYIINHELHHQEISSIIIQLAQTLQTLHQNHIIHRDIKPENIFYNGKIIHLFDFHISKRYKENQNRDTQLLGSHGYAAPEQYGFAQSDSRTDIYALGILWNMMLTGHFPQEHLYQGKETYMIQKAIHIDPNQRYQTVDELLFDLEKQKKKLSYFLSKILHKILRYFYTEKTNKRTWKLPGFRENDGKVKSIIYICLYVFIILITCISSFEGIQPGTFDDILNRFAIFSLFMMLILFCANYANIYDECLFSNSKSLIIKIIGRILTFFLFLFLWLMIYSFLSDLK